LRAGVAYLKFASGQPLNPTECDMPREHYIRLIAGTFVMGSLALGWFVSPYWFLFMAFVGLNLFQSDLSKWCLTKPILRKLNVGR